MQSAQQTNALRDSAIAIVTERIDFEYDASEYCDDIAACVDRAMLRSSGTAHNVAMSALDEMDALIGGYHAQWTADGGAS